MAMFINVLMLTCIIVTSARKIPFTSKEVAHESQTADFINEHKHVTAREEIIIDDQNQRDQARNLNTNEQDTSSETRRKSFRNIDTRAYDNLNIKNAGNDRNIQGDQSVRSNSNNKNRLNWNKGGEAATHTQGYNENKNDRRNSQNKKQTKIETTEKIHTDSRFNEKEKTTRENEVTPKTDKKMKKPKDQEEDRWIWPNEEKVVTTTEASKAVTFEDRANFSGGSCPTGQADGRHQASKIQSSRPSPDLAGADSSMTVARGDGSPERLGGALRRLHYKATRRAHSAAARHHNATTAPKPKELRSYLVSHDTTFSLLYTNS